MKRQPISERHFVTIERASGVEITAAFAKDGVVKLSGICRAGRPHMLIVDVNVTDPEMAWRISGVFLALYSRMQDAKEKASEPSTEAPSIFSKPPR